MIKVLVIDDDANIRTIMCMMLSNLGCLTAEAGNGHEGETTALEWHPDLIFLDIMMPGQDGFQTCSSLRSRGYKGPIFLLSALSQGIVAAQVVSCRANGFFTKP